MGVLGSNSPLSKTRKKLCWSDHSHFSEKLKIFHFEVHPLDPIICLSSTNSIQHVRDIIEQAQHKIAHLFALKSNTPKPTKPVLPSLTSKNTEPSQDFYLLLQQRGSILWALTVPLVASPEKVRQSWQQAPQVPCLFVSWGRRKQRWQWWCSFWMLSLNLQVCWLIGSLSCSVVPKLHNFALPPSKSNSCQAVHHWSCLLLEAFSLLVCFRECTAMYAVV